MNHGYEYRESVPREAAGLAVIDWLSRRHAHSSAAVWQARIAAGEVLLDGEAAAATDELRSGQRLIWRRPPWEEPAVPLGFGILYRDQHLIAVAKPRGLPSIPNGGFLEHTLLHQVRRCHAEAVPMHRLGRGTSGIVLFARTAEARRAVAAEWRRGEVAKEYRALVVGHPERDTFIVDVPIGLVPHSALGHVHAADAAGRPSRSQVRVLDRGLEATLVSVSIPTGRPHQIRIHLAAAGHPLVGDLLYLPGGVPGPRPALPGDGGYWLHAHRLELTHPVSRARIVFECPPPAPLRTKEESARTPKLPGGAPA